MHSTEGAPRKHFEEGVDCRPQSICYACGICHFNLQALNLRIVVLQRRADSGLKSIDGDKVWEQWQHILYANLALGFIKDFNYCGNALLLHATLQGQLSMQTSWISLSSNRPS